MLEAVFWVSVVVVVASLAGGVVSVDNCCSVQVVQGLNLVPFQ